MVDRGCSSPQPPFHCGEKPRILLNANELAAVCFRHRTRRARPRKAVEDDIPNGSRKRQERRNHAFGFLRRVQRIPLRIQQTLLARADGMLRQR
jgi:hypothetical protein